MLIVQKFGGTSVANLERIKASSSIVNSSLKMGHKVIVVVSAMAKETDRLIELYKSLVGNHTEDSKDLLAEMDFILSTGEQTSAGLFAASLLTSGIKARSLTGFSAGILTNGEYGRAKIENIIQDKILDLVNSGITPVICGFQGYFLEEERVTTLGRGGSDTSAIAIAAAVKADKCEIYKDVDGVFTADPNVVLDAEKLPKLSYNAVMEITSGGAKVLEARSTNFALKYNVKTELLSSFNPKNEGTIIVEENINENAEIYNISKEEKEDLFSIPLEKKNEMFDLLQQSNIRFNFLSMDEKMINFLILKKDIEKVKKMLNGFTGFNVVSNVIKISIVGCFLSGDNIFFRALNVLEKEKMNLIFSLSSESKIVLILKDIVASEVLNLLHKNLPFKKRVKQENV